ncbi:unnamed protein product, partial [Symbiodinium necroappetens]
VKFSMQARNAKGDDGMFWGERWVRRKKDNRWPARYVMEEYVADIHVREDEDWVPEDLKSSERTWDKLAQDLADDFVKHGKLICDPFKATTCQVEVDKPEQPKGLKRFALELRGGHEAIPHYYQHDKRDAKPEFEHSSFDHPAYHEAMWPNTGRRIQGSPWTHCVTNKNGYGFWSTKTEEAGEGRQGGNSWEPQAQHSAAASSSAVKPGDAAWQWHQDDNDR